MLFLNTLSEGNCIPSMFDLWPSDSIFGMSGLAEKSTAQSLEFSGVCHFHLVRGLDKSASKTETVTTFLGEATSLCGLRNDVASFQNMTRPPFSSALAWLSAESLDRPFHHEYFCVGPSQPTESESPLPTRLGRESKSRRHASRKATRPRKDQTYATHRSV